MTDEIKNSGTKEEWQAEVISKLAFAAVDEQRRTRRWGIFFKALFFLFTTNWHIFTSGENHMQCSYFS